MKPLSLDDSLRKIADTIDLASESLFNAIKYCYLVSETDFYNVNVKDIFKMGLNNLTNPDCFANLGLNLDESRIGEMGTEHFKEILSIIRYSFAIRLPFIKKYATESSIKDNHIKLVYDALEKHGFLNPDGIVEESFKSMSWMVRTKKNEPPFETEWFRRWIYTYGHDLAAINNRNMFMLGCVEALFPLYYASLQDMVVNEMNKI